MSLDVYDLKQKKSFRKKFLKNEIFFTLGSGATTFGITTLSIMTFSTTIKNVATSAINPSMLNDIQHDDT
jgi:hypothetical protein